MDEIQSNLIEWNHGVGISAERIFLGQGFGTTNGQKNCIYTHIPSVTHIQLKIDFEYLALARKQVYLLRKLFCYARI